MSRAERIVAAALKVGCEVVSLPPPARHSDVYRYASVAWSGCVEGFLTSTGRFVDRTEAAAVARAARQTRTLTPLQSTDLW